MQTKVTPGEIVVMAAGAVALIASFLPFYTNGDDTSTWEEGLFPVATLIVLFAVIAGVLVALAKFANVTVTGFLGFGLQQLVLLLGFFSAVLAVGFLVAPREFTIAGIPLGEVDLGIGYYLLLLAALGSIVGAVLVAKERRSTGTL